MTPDEAVQALALVVTAGFIGWMVSALALSWLARIFRAG